MASIQKTVLEFPLWRMQVRCSKVDINLLAKEKESLPCDESDDAVVIYVSPSRELFLFSIAFQLVDAPSLETLKVRLGLTLSTCSSCRCSCSLQRSKTSWPLRVLSNSMILWYLSFFKHFYLSTANDEGLEVKQLMRLGTAIFKTADQTAVLLS